MRDSIRYSVALGVAVSIGFLTACSSNRTSPPMGMQFPAALPQSASHAQIANVPNVLRSYVYVSEANSYDVRIFSKSSGKQVGLITWSDGYGALGIAFSSAGNVYVARPGPGTVEVYKPLAPKPFLTLSDPKHRPYDVVVGSSGTVYTANNDGTISVYAPGSKMPTSTLTDSDASQNQYLALDSHENVYMTFVSKATGNGAVAEFRNGSPNAVNLGLKGLTANVAAIDIANNGNLVVCNQTVGILTFVPGDKSAFSTIPATSDWVEIALNKSNSEIYVGDVTNGKTVSLAYPSGTPDDVLAPTVFPFGIAITGNLTD